MDLNKYPRTKKLMEDTGMNLQQTYEYVENEMKKRGLI